MRDAFFAVALLLLFSCYARQPENLPEIKVGGKAYVKIEAKNVQDSAHIYSSYWPLLLGQHEFFTDEYKIAADSSFFLVFDISVPSKHHIYLGKEFTVPVFLVPEDTLTLYVDYQQGKSSDQVKFTGTYANVCQYLYEKPDHITFSVQGSSVFNDPYYSETPERTLLQYQQISDSVAKRQQDYLQKKKEKYTLPNWFIAFENMEASLFAAYHQEVLPDYWQKMMRVKLEIPEDYYDKIRKIDLNNSSALLPFFFYLYAGKKLKDSLQVMKQEQALLDQLGKESLDDIKSTQAYERYAVNLFKSMGEKADQLLTDDAFYIFLTQQFFHYTDREGSLITQQCLDYVKTKLEHTAYLPFLLEHYENFSHHLASGDEAPGFYLLSDQQEQYLSLSDFKGEVVLLNFWFPGCKPCIAEIPHEQALIEKYGESGFNILNICLEATPEQWRKAILKFGLAGTNVVTQGRWERKLKEAYSVGGFPHYVLIDQQGIIIENKTYKPSDSRLSNLIEDHLNF